MKVLVSTYPYAGHFNPTQPVVCELVRRGHEVVWMTGPAFAAKVVQTGARFVAMSEAALVDDAHIHRIDGKITLAKIAEYLQRLFLDRIPAQIQDYRGVIEGRGDTPPFAADVLVVDFCTYAARCFYDLTGLPYATLGINPLVTLDPEIPPWGTGLPPPTTRLGLLLNYLRHQLGILFFIRGMSRSLNAQRRALGLPPRGRWRSYADDVRSPDLHIMMTTPAFEFPRKNMLPAVRFVGPLLPTWMEGGRAGGRGKRKQQEEKDEEEQKKNMEKNDKKEGRNGNGNGKEDEADNKGQNTEEEKNEKHDGPPDEDAEQQETVGSKKKGKEPEAMERQDRREATTLEGATDTAKETDTKNGKNGKHAPADDDDSWDWPPWWDELLAHPREQVVHVPHDTSAANHAGRLIRPTVEALAGCDDLLVVMTGKNVDDLFAGSAETAPRGQAARQLVHQKDLPPTPGKAPIAPPSGLPSIPEAASEAANGSVAGGGGGGDGESLMAAPSTAAVPEEVPGGEPIVTTMERPANVRTAAVVPPLRLLPHVGVVVTNAGYSGVLAALRCGVPLVCAGRSEDKADVSSRVAWSGAGINLGTGRPAAAAVRDAVLRITSPDVPKYRKAAAAIRDDFARHDGPAEAADLLEALVATKKTERAVQTGTETGTETGDGRAAQARRWWPTKGPARGTAPGGLDTAKGRIHKTYGNVRRRMS